MSEKEKNTKKLIDILFKKYEDCRHKKYGLSRPEIEALKSKKS